MLSSVSHEFRTPLATIKAVTTKFRDGAWIVLILTPLLVTIFFSIHHHSKNLARSLSLDDFSNHKAVRHHKVILPISSVHRGTLQALDYAQSLSYDVTAVHIAIDPAQAEKVRQKWELWGNGTRLVILAWKCRTRYRPTGRCRAWFRQCSAARLPCPWRVQFTKANLAVAVRPVVLRRWRCCSRRSPPGFASVPG